MNILNENPRGQIAKNFPRPVLLIFTKGTDVSGGHLCVYARTITTGYQITEKIMHYYAYNNASFKNINTTTSLLKKSLLLFSSKNILLMKSWGNADKKFQCMWMSMCKWMCGRESQRKTTCFVYPIVFVTFGHFSMVVL